MNNLKKLKLYYKLTKKEIKIINLLSKKEFDFFILHFYKISPLKWNTDLKNYEDTYFISEIFAILNGYYYLF